MSYVRSDINTFPDHIPGSRPVHLCQVWGAILRQPGSLAWQLFDQKTVTLPEPQYGPSQPRTADTLEQLIQQLDLDDRPQALRTLQEFNAAACDPDHFDPSTKDGLATRGLVPNKSNWAL